MAILALENGTVYADLEKITPLLSQLNVQLNYWPLDKARQDLLTKQSLESVEKEELLESVDHYFEYLKAKKGYQSRDLVVLHPDTENLAVLLNKFASCHTHDDDEVRYILDGEGVFGFVFPDGTQAELTVQAQEYINVPKNTEHWFHLTSSQRVKAVRYFVNTDGWVPVYTNTPIRFSALVSL